MSGLDDIVGLFFDEADQLLGDLEEALLELETRPEDPDLVAFVFRVLHTLKGAGAMYGFDAVSACAHSVETLFDEVRKGLRTLDAEMVAYGLRSRDVLSALVVEKESAEACVAAEALIADIEGLLSGSRAVPTSDEAALAGAVERPAQSRLRTISLTPSVDAFRRGLRLVAMLSELEGLGEAAVSCDVSRIPSLSDLDPEDCHFAWTVELHTSRPDADISEALMFLTPEEWSVTEGDSDAFTHLGMAVPSPAGTVPPPGPPAERRESRSRRKGAASLSRSLRVPAERLDEIVDLIGELVTVQAGLAEVAARSDDPLVSEMSERIERVSHSLRSSVLTIRMVPVGSLFTRFRRHVRDLAEELGKQVLVEIDGGETELDKSVIDRIEEPLLHLVRNCLSHGIESPGVRLAKGKAPAGRVMLSAFHAGGNVYIRVRDDGQGVDLERVRARAVAAGLCDAETEITLRQALDYITTPGFSTASEVTSVAGRGVGLDVVKRTIEDLQGSLQLEIADDGGLVTTLRLPLTLAVVEGLLVTVSEERYVLPLAVVEECVELSQQSGWADHGRNLLKMRDELIPFARLRDIYEVPGETPANELAIVVRDGDHRFGIVVDSVIDRLQTVMKMLGRAVRRTEGVSGATVLGDGSIALIIDVGQIAAVLGEATGVQEQAIPLG